MNSFLLHLASCLMMTGIIWYVQIAHYPLLRQIRDIPAYEKRYYPLASIVIIPIMAVEAITAIAITVGRVFIDPYWYASLGLLGLVWLVTILIHIPAHQKLQQQRDESVIEQIIRYNWIRTFFWSLRSLILMNYWIY